LAKPKKQLKNQNKKSKPLQDVEENSSESESEAETDAEDKDDIRNVQDVDLQSEIPPNLVDLDDPNGNHRSIEVPPADF